MRRTVPGASFVSATELSRVNERSVSQPPCMLTRWSPLGQPPQHPAEVVCSPDGYADGEREASRLMSGSWAARSAASCSPTVRAGSVSDQELCRPASDRVRGEEVRHHC